MPNVQDIISQIVSLRSDTEIKFHDLKSIIDNALPGWITHIMSEYSDDYPHFTNNWNHITGKINTTKKYIILVDENVTAIGCIVRLNTDFFECKKCNKAICSEKLYNMFKQHNGNIPNRQQIKIPELWSCCCKTCQ